MKKLLQNTTILMLSAMLCGIANAQVIRTIAGVNARGYSGDGYLSVNASIGTISGITTDNRGNIYISDVSNNTVRKITPNLIITTIAGIEGNPGFSGDGGAATAARLYSPMGLVTDGYGNLYITDNGNSAVRKVDTNGIITTIAGIGGIYGWGYSGDGGPATGAMINGGMALAMDRYNNLYIADGNTRVRKVNAAGIITTVAGSGAFGYSGDGGAATAASMEGPQGIAVDTFGNIYISDALNNVIRKVNTSGIIQTICGTHVAGYNGDNIAALTAQIKNPGGLQISAAGNLLISDKGNNRIRMIDHNGTITTIAGNGLANYNGDGNNATNASIAQPVDVNINTKGNLLIGDANNFVVREVVYPTNTIMNVGWSTSFCNGTSITFAPITSNTLYMTAYEWALNGIRLGITTGSYTNASLVSGDVVTCYIVDPFKGFVVDSNANTVMTVYPSVAPAISTTIVGGTDVCAGANATYNAMIVNGGSTPLVQWTVNGINAATGETFSYVPNNLDVVNCFLVSNAMCRTTDTADAAAITMVVNPIVSPLIHITAATGSTIPAGAGSITLTATETYGGTLPQYQWMLNGNNIDGATGPDYTCSGLMAGDVIFCQLVSNATCVTTSTVTSNSLEAIVPVAPFAHLPGSFSSYVYPNPNNGQFEIKASAGTDITETVNYFVTDITGRVINTGATTVNHGNIETHVALGDQLPNGIYIFNINSGNVHVQAEFVLAK